MIKTTCTQGRDGVYAAKTCINLMASGSILKLRLGNDMEDFSGSIGPRFGQMLTGIPHKIVNYDLLSHMD